VMPEEFAFRGVLRGLFVRRWGRWAATGVSSVLFGFWHVAPALAGGSANRAVDVGR
jgi:membrane protease YdiL (CAAX protease family)